MSQPRKRARTSSFIPTPASAGSFGRSRGRSYRKAAWKKTRKSVTASNAKIGKIMSDFMETKYYPVAPQNNSSPNAIQALALAYSKKYVLGAGLPSTFAHQSSWTAVDGMAMTQGDGRNQRIGDSVFLHNTKGMITIDAGVADAPGDDRPIEYRMIIARQRQRGTALGRSFDPDTALFRDHSGNMVGDYSGGINGIDLMTNDVNKDLFTVFMDKKFTLGQDADAFTDPLSVKPGNVKYPSTITVPYNLIHDRKVDYQGSGSGNPLDYDSRFMIFIYASAVGRTTKADGWTVNVRGTTKYLDP